MNIIAAKHLQRHISSALGEEVGWRGFLVPVILLGNYHKNSQVALPRWGQVVMFFICVVSAAVIMAYLRLKSGSLWTGVVFHASHNMFIQTVFNPLTIQYHDTAKYADELGLVLPLTLLPVAIYFFLHATVFFPRHGIVVRNEDDPIPVVNANGERTRPVALQFFAPRTRKAPDHREIVGGIRFIEPLPNLLPALLSKPLPQTLVVVAEVRAGRCS
jgi:hypothetical protein